MKSAVYSWRVRPETLLALEELARSEGRRISDILESLVADRLASVEPSPEDVRARALQLAGTIRGGDPHRAENAAHIVSKRLRARTRRAHRTQSAG